MKSNENVLNRINLESKVHTNFNKNIRIYRTDIEKIKSQLERRMSDVWDIYYSESQWDEEYAYSATSANEVWEELVRTKCSCNKADNLLADESFDFIYVDADEWFDEWSFEELIEDGLIDKYYMFPNSDEVDEILLNLKQNIKNEGDLKCQKSN